MKIEVIPGRLTVETHWVAAIEVMGHMPHQSMTITLHGGEKFYASKSDHPDFSATKVLGQFHEAGLDLGEAEGKVRAYDNWAPHIQAIADWCVKNGIGKVGEEFLPAVLTELKRKAAPPLNADEVEDIKWAIEQAESWKGAMVSEETREEHIGNCIDARAALAKVSK